MATSIVIRMYNQQNLGDCFLLKCRNGRRSQYILIDFGSYFSGNDEREMEIANDIRATVKKDPLIIVLTHQHKDHLSGFITAKAVFEQMNIAEVWFSYLDDPTGEAGIAMRDATEKFWKKNLENKTKAARRFADSPEVEAMLEAKKKFDLFAEDQSGGEAITNLLNWCNYNCRFLQPGELFGIPNLAPGAINTYVLGPPTDPTLLRKLNPNIGDEVHGFNISLQLANLSSSSEMLSKALDTITPGAYPADDALEIPFNQRYCYPLHDKQKTLWQQKKYTDEENAWRRIDHEWLGELGRLSLHMDTLTNNSSLVLAFELEGSNKVALFVGDAQIGNWKSWFDVEFAGTTKKAEQLLQRTGFYKAGHHSSHNATLSQGLDLMNEKDLVIMIPVNQEVSDKMRFAMLKPGMLAGYNRKSGGRVLRGDTIFQPEMEDHPCLHRFAEHLNDFTPAIKRQKDNSGTEHLYVEYIFK